MPFIKHTATGDRGCFYMPKQGLPAGDFGGVFEKSAKMFTNVLTTHYKCIIMVFVTKKPAREGAKEVPK